MKQLQELAGIPSRATVRQILKGNGRVKATESLTHKLYELIRKGDLDDDGIVKKLYGKNRTPSYGPYRTLKTRLRHVLVQAVLLSESEAPSYSTYNEAYQHGFRQLGISRILISYRAYTAAREIARHTFLKVREFEIIPINQGLTEILSSSYLGVNYDEDKFLEYNDLNEYYSKAAADLSKVGNRYRIIRNKIYAHRDPPYKIGDLAGEYAEECRSIAEKYDTASQIQVMFTDFEVTGCILRREYKQAIAASEKAAERIKKCKGVGGISQGLMALTRVECSLKLKDFRIGIEQIEKARKIIPNKSINGLKLTEFAIKLGLETGNYKYSYSQMASLDKKTLNRYFTERHLEYWRILEAYVNLLVISGEVKVGEDEPKLPSFRLGSFMNNVPSYSRNKEGMNTQIIILQVMFFIISKKYSQAIDRTEALERYCSRYLTKGDNFRNNCFFKMLLCVIKANFNRVATERKAKEYYDKLINETIDGSGASDMEWISYEEMWRILLAHLPSKRRMSAR